MKTIKKGSLKKMPGGGALYKSLPKAQTGGGVDLEKKEKALNAGPGVRLAPKGSTNRVEQERRAKKRITDSKPDTMKKGGSVKKMQVGGRVGAGIPYATGAGQTDGKNGMMKKGGSTKKKK